MDCFWKFIDSNFFQTIILIVTVAATIWIYYAQKRTERRDAARAIIIQIDIVNRRVDSLAYILGSDITKFDMEQFWQSEDIIDVNEWNKYSHMFVRKLHYNEIVSLNNYFDNVELIGRQQREIKQTVCDILKKEVQNNTEGSTVEPQINVPTLFFKTIQRQYEKIVEGRAAVPYEQLKKIAKI